MVNTREKEAADAYLKFLQSKGAPSGMLYLRSRFLDTFILKLKGKIQTRKEFAYALEEIIASLPIDDKDRGNALSTAREFFPFWMNDIKAIAMFQEFYGFNVNEIKWEPKHTTLKALTDDLDLQKLTAAEEQSLQAYVQAITKLGADTAVVDTRSKLAKIILIRLRDAPTTNHAIYRISVDLTLQLFKTKEIKQLYLDVVREFYHFWTNDPDAEAKVFG
ncbi:MAG: hypothetical protein COB34_07410 [Methylophilaceae bacterium]|nr:MAG: hypothetical protein COB34_07410 [Methylophilaceae bacterium]